MSDCNAEQHQESQRQSPPMAMDQLAIEKAGNIPGWRPYLYDSTKQGLRVTGCLTTEYSRGPRKGEIKYLTSEKRISVLLTREELRAFVPRPCRIQLRRSKGWRLPANSVKVDRSTKWGNPVVVGGMWEGQKIETAEQAVALFKDGIARQLDPFPREEDIRRELAGKNPACWCQKGSPCHADVLLQIANSN